ncbi:MAG: hypothetical protein AB1476_03440 [Candidatus Hadarchaeota archaeon]
MNRTDRIEAEKIRCVGRSVSKPRFVQWSSRHRAMEVFVEWRPAIAEVAREWRVLKE